MTNRKISQKGNIAKYTLYKKRKLIDYNYFQIELKWQ